MNKAPKIFSFNGIDFRTAIVDGEPWFAIKDVCNTLGNLSYTDILRCLSDDEKRVVQFHDTEKESYFINEDALFNLISNSTSNNAETLTNWINQHVLPELYRECSRVREPEVREFGYLVDRFNYFLAFILSGKYLFSLSLQEHLTLKEAAEVLKKYDFYKG